MTLRVSYITRTLKALSGGLCGAFAWGWVTLLGLGQRWCYCSRGDFTNRAFA